MLEAGDTSLDEHISALILTRPDLEAALEDWRKDMHASVAHTEDNRQIGNYAMIRLLGSGGMGSVWLAKDQILGRLVALKVLHADATFSPIGRARFEREVRILAKLDHQNICTVFEVGENEGRPFMAMRWVPGQSLADIIRAGRERRSSESHSSAISAPVTSIVPAPVHRKDLNQALLFAEDIARAAHAAHQADCVHRDIKPGNIMLSKTGVPVLVDFGMARDVGSKAPSLTRSGAVVGTPLHMAPEQVNRALGDIDRRTDVYALGATIYELLTLTPPIAPTPDHTLNDRILNVDPPRASKVNRALSGDVDIVLATALDKEPRRRYPTAQALADDLRRLRLGEPIAARVPSRIRRLGLWMRRNPAATTVLTILVLALALTSSLSIALQQARAAESALAAEKATSTAEALLRDGDHESALRAFEEAEARGYKDHVRLLLGRLASYDALALVDKFDATLANLVAITNHGPHAARVLLVQADNLMWDDGARAQQLLDRAIAMHMDGAALLTPSDLRYARACREPSLHAFADGLVETLSLDPKHYAARTALCYARLMQGRPRDVLAMTEQFRSLYPRDPFGPSMAAFAYCLLDDQVKCKSSLQLLKAMSSRRAADLVKCLKSVTGFLGTLQAINTAHARSYAEGLVEGAGIKFPNVAPLCLEFSTRLANLLANLPGRAQLGRIRIHPSIARDYRDWIEHKITPSLARLRELALSSQLGVSFDECLPLAKATPEPGLNLLSELDQLSDNASTELFGQWLDAIARYWGRESFSYSLSGFRRHLLSLAYFPLKVVSQRLSSSADRKLALSLLERYLPICIQEAVDLPLSDTEYTAYTRITRLHPEGAKRAMLTERLFEKWRADREGLDSPSLDFLCERADWCLESGQVTAAEGFVRHLRELSPYDKRVTTLESKLWAMRSTPR